MSYEKRPDDYPYLVLPELIEMSYPLPYLMFTQDGTNNNGYPYLSFLGPMITASPLVFKGDYITVYDMHCEQHDFENNGICILWPTMCEITEELNGMYELSLEHPIDAEGRWKSLLELNIIKANGQLFRIYKKTTSMSDDGSKLRKVYARHIFYDLNDKLLIDVRPTDKSGRDFLTWIMTRMFNEDPGHYYPFYTYSWHSDIETKATAYYEAVSPVAALIGEDNCFLNRLGGEIYRDNFYFSINQRREFSEDEVFCIRYGVDMLEIEENIDYSELITHLRAQDNYGHTYAVSYTGTPRLHHNVTRLIRFNYSEDDPEGFGADVRAYFGDHWQPKVNYKVKFANLQDNELYKDFLNLQKCNVGDTGYIYCEELGIETKQKVIKKTIDCLTGEVISIELGNLNGSLTRNDKLSSTIMSGSMTAAEKASQSLQSELHRTKLKFLSTWGSAQAFTWREAEQYTWKETEEG